MKHLEKITISNVRRFGENVEIKIGKGATIFLAPNGTGKTAVFEAIELALTGKVKRLLFPPEPLIRDCQTSASIKLDFEDGKFCEAIFNKGSHPVLTGHHNELFQKVEEQDLPFLLQLTHFLNQQGNNWFVNSHGPEAGSQLDHLSIGREALEVNHLIPSAKRAASAELSQAQREFNEIDERWQQWRSLLSKRKDTSVGLVNELVSKDNLLEQMNLIAVQFTNFTRENSLKLVSLKVLNADLGAAVNNNLEVLKNSLVEFRTFISLITEFEAATSNLSEAKERYLRFQDATKARETEIASLKTQIESKGQALGIKETSIIGTREIQRQYNQLQGLNGQQDKLKAKQKELNQEIGEVNERWKKAQANLSSARESNAAHEILNKRKQAIISEENKTENLKSITENIESKNLRLSELLEVIIPHVKEQVMELTRAWIDSERLELAGQEKLNKSQQSFDTLNKTSDIINAAVATIISEYPKDKGDCPVCGSEFAPEVLQSRMKETAQSLLPGLQVLSEAIDKAKIELKTCAETTRLSQENLTKKQSELTSYEIEANSISLEVEHVLTNSFEGSKNIAGAKALIEERIIANRISKDRLAADTALAPKMIISEKFAILSQEAEDIDKQLTKLTEDLSKANIELESVTANIQALTNRIGIDLDISQISQSLVTMEEELATLKNEIVEIRTKLDNENREHVVSKDNAVREEINISQLTTRVSEYRSRWGNAKLTGEPSKDELSKKISSFEAQVVKSENERISLYSIDRELNKWQVFEDEQRTEQEIRTWIGEATEADFNSRLEEDLQSRKQRLEALGQNVQVLTTFSECLASELDVVHQRIVSINPLWKKLLKRIIIDPRFSDTQLDSFSYYKKQHANVNVKLHGENVLVSQVASEAQITDLQLTFMLAMAQKYQWTSWKSLLLDDPTQHHDLVHASAVFDLLRDYIVDFDFQILMATHDPVQAKFFMRKLENDGIPVNICNLFATEEGVEARIDD